MCLCDELFLHMKDESPFGIVRVGRLHSPFHTIRPGRQGLEGDTQDAPIKVNAAVIIIHSQAVRILDDNRGSRGLYPLAEKNRHFARCGLNTGIRRRIRSNDKSVGKYRRRA